MNEVPGSTDIPRRFSESTKSCNVSLCTLDPSFPKAQMRSILHKHFFSLKYRVLAHANAWLGEETSSVITPDAMASASAVRYDYLIWCLSKANVCTDDEEKARRSEHAVYMVQRV